MVSRINENSQGAKIVHFREVGGWRMEDGRQRSEGRMEDRG